MPQLADDYDSPWKEGLEIYLRPTLEFCFPQVAEAIDWAKPVEFLDKELQEVIRDAALSEQRVDKLIKVQLRDGGEEWILVHVEVQHQHDVNLTRRLYEAGLERKDILELYRLVDWLMRLPTALEQEYKRSIERVRSAENYAIYYKH